MKAEDHKPPRIADRFLSWYCSARVREQVQGDAHELYYWRLEQKGAKSANRAFVWDVVRLFKWSNIKRKNRQTQKLNNIAMFKNYFKIGLRNLWKQKMPSTINVIGLSFAIGCCLVAFKFIEMALIRDDFHQHGEDIYLVTHTAFVDEDVNRYGQISLAISDLMSEGFPAIKEVVKYNSLGVGVTIGDDVFSNRASFVDDSFLETFTFPLIYGEKDVLRDQKNVVLSERMAATFFADEYPIGKTLSLLINDVKQEFVVAGVLMDAPGSSSMRPRILLNYEVLRAGKDVKTMNSHVFVHLENGADVDNLLGQFDRLVEVQKGFNLDRKYESIGLQPLESMALNSDEVINGLGIRLPMAPMILIAAIGLFMLILSIFNYVNIATLMATKRIKEIGVRKVIGGKRGQLILQFLTENFILCLLSMIVGCLLASGFFLPQFNIISGNDFTLDLLNHKRLWVFLGGLLLLVTLASGAYPAFFVSSFKAVNIFRGSEKTGRKRRFTGVLLSFQFTLAIITIVAGYMAVNTNRINQNKSWGFNQENKLVIEVRKEEYAQLVAEARKNPRVNDLAGSAGSIGMFYDYQPFTIGDTEIHGGILKGDVHYAELLEIDLVTGRYFEEDLVSDLTSAVLVNETFVKSFGLDMSKDHTVDINNGTYQIVGVLEDFYFASISDVIDPAVMFALPDSLLTHVTLSTDEASLLALRDEMERSWEELDFTGSFDSQFQTEAFDSDFEDMKGLRNILLFVATLAILLSSMGLFGLVSLSISSKIKVYGIKKVLGASRRNLAMDVYKGFSLILGIAIVVGSAVAIKLVDLLMDSAYGDHAPIGIIPLGVSALILLAVAAFTINTQLSRVQRMNPAQTLRTE